MKGREVCFALFQMQAVQFKQAGTFLAALSPQTQVNSTLDAER